MSTPRVNWSASCTREFVRQGAFSDEPFVLADVGCSGGISEHWRQFEPALRSFGFDPLVHECERLNRIESNSAVRYFDRFIGWSGYSELFPDAVRRDPVQGWSNQPFVRTSAARAQEAQAESFVQTVFNSGHTDLKYTDLHTSLDEFFADQAGVQVDFIKVDTDGHDYEVLCGARRLLDAHHVLGLLVEIQFHGVSHPHANLFANIDRLLREHGFSLFDVETYRYTRRNLPGHFVHPLAAQTHEGQVLAGDALYLRDLAAPGYEARWGGALRDSKLLKLVCLFEIFGMPDCAAELLEVKRGQLGKHIDIPRLLDLLARKLHPAIGSYAALNRRFSKSAERFYPLTPGRFLRRVLPGPLYRLLAATRRGLRG